MLEKVSRARRNPARTWPGVIAAGSRRARLPGQAGDGREVAGDPELGVGGDQEPGPAVGGGGVPQQRPGPAELLLEEPERVLEVEPPQVGLPQDGDQVRRRGPGTEAHSHIGFGAARRPGGRAARNRIRVPSMTGSVLAGGPVLEPAGAAVHLLVDPRPGRDGNRAVTGLAAFLHDRRAVLGCGVGAADRGPVPRCPPGRARDPGRGRAVGTPGRHGPAPSR